MAKYIQNLGLAAVVAGIMASSANAAITYGGAECPAFPSFASLEEKHTFQGRGIKTITSTWGYADRGNSTIKDVRIIEEVWRWYSFGGLEGIFWPDQNSEKDMYIPRKDADPSVVKALDEALQKSIQEYIEKYPNLPDKCKPSS